MGKIGILLNLAYIGVLGTNAFAGKEGRELVRNFDKWYQEYKEARRREAVDKAIQQKAAVEDWKKKHDEWQKQYDAWVASHPKEKPPAAVVASRPKRPASVYSPHYQPAYRPAWTPPAADGAGHVPTPPPTGGGSWRATVAEGDRYWQQGMATSSNAEKRQLLQQAIDCFHRALSSAPPDEQPKINMKIMGAKKSMPLF